MLTDRDFLALEHRYLVLAGWKNLVEVDGSFLGLPPSGPECRGQAMAPHVVRSWNDCGDMIPQYGIELVIEPNKCAIIIIGFLQNIYDFKNFSDSSIACRYGIVDIVCTVLELNNKSCIQS